MPLSAIRKTPDCAPEKTWLRRSFSQQYSTLHGLPMGFLLELRDEADDRRGASVGIGFAVADETFVGIDADQRRLPVIGDDGGLDVGDLHIR